MLSRAFLATARLSARHSPQCVRSVRGIASAPLTVLKDDERMFQESVAAFAQDVIEPRVADMDESALMDPTVLQGLFDNGLMGVEIDEQ